MIVVRIRRVHMIWTISSRCEKVPSLLRPVGSGHRRKTRRKM
jgi:hypothetical protein